MAAKPRFDGEWVRLGELVSKAKSKRCGSEIYPVLSMTMHDGIVEQADRFKKKIASRDTSSYKVVEPGQLVVGFPIDEGVIYVQNYPYPGIMSPAYNVWDINGDLIDPAYLELVLHGPKSMAYYADKMRGTTARRRSLTADNLCAMRVPLPSLERQRRVVHLFNTVKDEMAIAGRVVEALDQLVKSRFAEMFGDPVSNDRGWVVSTIKETASTYGDGPFGSNLKTSDYVDEGVRVIRLGNIQQGRFSEKDRSFVSYEKYELLKRYECLPGEIVIATLGDPILRACLVPGSCSPSIHKADCMYYEVDRNKLIPTFAMWAINHSSMLRRAMVDAHGQTRGRINSTQAGNLPMVVPPLALQQEFADFAAEVDKSRFIVQQQIEKLQMLYDSLAQEYFS